MDAMGLPMSFGKKAKAGPVNMKAKVDTTKRAGPSESTSSTAGPSSRPPAISPATPRGTTVDDEQGLRTNGREGLGRSNGQRREASEEDIGPAPPAEGDDDSEGDIGPMPPTAGSAGIKRKASAGAATDSDLDDEDEDDADDAEADRLPVSHEIVLKDHTKVCSALAVDPSGARIASGSHDYDTKIWDFGGMDSRLKPFKSFEANGNYHVHDLDFSPDGKRLLVISGTFFPKVYDRDGDAESAMEFMKGDPYLRDMKNTKGHTAEIHGGRWHPSEEGRFLTCSSDSTLRIWDVSERYKQKQVIVVKSKERGARTKVTSCAWNHDGKLVAGACLDGTLNVWSTNSNFARPDKSCEIAHAKNTETTGVAFARDGHRIVTRGGDDTVKLWDIRSIRKPVAVAANLDNVYSETNIVFSPDDKSVLTGVAARKGEKGAMVVLGGDGLQEERRVTIGEGSVVRVLWHSRINQIFATLSTGAIHVLYSPRSSIHGALLPLAKLPRSTPRDVGLTSADIQPVIYNPDALPMFADKNYRESLHQKEKRAKKLKPQEPISGVGKGGRLGASAMQSLVQTMYPAEMRFEDPREALLKYAEKKDEEE